MAHNPRTCIVTREPKEKAQLIRFVAAPDGMLVPDLAEKLPGRGVWVSADKETLETAIQTHAFARGLKMQVRIPERLLEQVASGLEKRVLHWLALANKGGAVVSGFEKVEAALRAPGKRLMDYLLLHAADAGRDLEKFARFEVARTPAFLSREQLGGIIGRSQTVHLLVTHRRFSQEIMQEMQRLAGFRENNAL